MLPEIEFVPSEEEAMPEVSEAAIRLREMLEEYGQEIFEEAMRKIYGIRCDAAKDQIYGDVLKY